METETLIVEGFWTVQFRGVQGWGTGVVVYMAGHVYGGNSTVMFTGTYTLQNNEVAMRLHVKQIVAGLMTVMGPGEYDLELTGKLEGDNLNLAGSIPGTDQKISAIVLKQCDLAPRS